MHLVEKNKIRVSIFATVCALSAVFAFGWDLVKAQERDNKLLNVSAYILNQENKEILNGIYNIRFAIYTVDRGESDPYPSNSDRDKRIWEEEQEIEVTNGLFDAYLGSSNPLPENIDLSNSKYYLGIRVGDDSETVPRKKMGYVPAALNAVNSTFVNGATTGTREGDILVLGKDGKIDLNRLPIEMDADSFVADDDDRLHEKNEDTGTESSEFNIGDSSNLNGNFDITVSDEENKPTIRFDGSSNEWQYSNDGVSFYSLRFNDGDFLELSGGTMLGNIDFYSGQTFGGATLTETGYLSGVTSSVQNQLNNRALLAHFHSVGDITSGVFGINRGGTGLSSIPMGSLLFSNVNNNLVPFTATSEDNEEYLRFNWNGGSPYLSWSSSVVGGFASFMISGDGGLTQSVVDGNNILITGGTNLNSVASATDTITLNLDSTLTGVTWNGNDIDISEYTNLAVGGTLLSRTNDTLSLREGTLTSGRLCTYDTTSGLVCNTDSSLVGHSATTIGAIANGLSINASQVLSLGLASGTTTGALSNTDWSTFNSKQNALTIGNLTGTVNQVNVTGGAGAIIGAGVSLSLPQSIATTSAPTFGGLTLNGNQTITGTLGIKETGTTPTYFTTFQGGDQGANITYTLPATQSAGANYVLANNGSGALSWQSVSGVGGMNSFLLAADTGTTQTIVDNETISIQGGTNIGSTIDSTNHVVLNLDTTLSGVTWNGTDIDISDYTNLAGNSEIVLTGDSLSIAASIARDSELHNAVTLAGQSYLSIVGQVISAGIVELGTHTSGNYVAGLTPGTAITISGTAAEGWSPTVGVSNDSIGDTQLTFNTGQDLTNVSTPTFGGLTLNGNQTITGTLGIKETGTTPTYFTTFQGGDQGANITYTLPATQSAGANYVLANNGSGALSWQSVSGVGGMNSFLLAADTGTTQTIVDNETISIQGGTNIGSTIDSTNHVVLNLDTTLSGVTWNGTDIDISDYTNLAGNSEIVLTGDSLSIAASIARDSELHNAVTLAGQSYLSIVGQVISAGIVELGTHTSGNYVAGLTPGTAITISGTAAEGWSPTVGVSNDSIGDTQLAFNTGQDLTATSTPTFGGLTLNGNQTITGTLGIKETGTTPTYFTTFQGGDQSANITYTLPTSNTNGLMRNTAGVLTWDTNTYLTGNQTITLSGDVTGTGTTAITAAVVNDSHDHSATTLPATISYLGSQIDVSDETNLAVGGILLVKTDDTLSIKEGALTSGRLCTYDTLNGLVCNTESSTVGHSAVTINAIANGLSVDGSQVLTLALANTTTTGALSNTDWNTFNNKQNTLTLGDITGTANQVAVTGGVGAIIGAGVSLSLPQDIATTSAPTFGGLTLNGNQTITGTLGIRESTGATYFTTFQGGDQSANITYTLPTTPGSSGYALKTDASGNLYWGAVEGGSGGIGTVTSVASGNGLTGGPITESGTLSISLLSTNTDSATASSYSGMEFVGGQLTLLRGCAVGDVMGWDDVAGTWKCTAVSGTGGGLTGTGSIGHLPYWSGTDSLAYDNDGNLFWDATTNRLGIGTLTPATALDVNGTITSTGLTLNGNQTITGTLGIKETGTTPTYFTTFQGGDQSANITYTLPTSNTNGLMRNTAGVLTWDTNTYLTGNQTITLSGDVTGTGTTAITAAVVNDSHDHSATTLPATISYLGSQIDVSDETNLAVGGILLVKTDDTLSIKEGALTSGRLCTYDTLNGLVCNTESSTVGHSAVTINAIANGLSVDGSQVLTLALANTTTTGALSNTDWNTFNNKQNTLTLGDITGTANQVAVTGGVGAIIGAGVSLSLPQDIATTSAPTFGGLTLNGNQTITGTLGIRESTGATYFTTFQGGDQSANITYTLPTSQAAGANYVLANDGNGALSWQLASTGTMTNPMNTLGDIIYGGAAGAPTRLAGAAGFLTSSGSAAPAWTSFATDSFTQYALLAGRIGGQTLIGGTAANDTLTLQGNSATIGNTLTNIGMQFNVGDSGATNAITILNNGNIGIGTTDINSKLTINGDVDIVSGTTTSGYVLETKDTHFNAGTYSSTEVSGSGLSAKVQMTPVDGGLAWTHASANWLPTSPGGYANPNFADIDNDGDYDMAVGNGAGFVYYYRNDGTASAPVWTQISTNWLNYDVGDNATPAFVDIDNDGKYDLAVGNYDGYIQYFHNDGTVSAPVWTQISTNWLNYDVGDNATPAFVDIDNDGDYDMAIGSGDSYVEYFRNDGNASAPSWTFVSNNWLGVYLGSPVDPAFVDIDNDGDYDMALGEFLNGNVRYYRNDGNASVPSWTLISTNWLGSLGGNAFPHPTFADVDNDGDTDLAVGDTSGYVHYYRHDISYPTSGTFISQNKNITYNELTFSSLTWTETLPAGADIQIRLRSAATEGGLSAATWYGPTSSSDYYSTAAGETINAIHNGDSWMQYQVYFTSTGTGTPALSDVTINFTYKSSVYVDNQGRFGIGGTPSSAFDLAHNFMIDGAGNVTAGNWMADFIDPSYGGTGANSSAWTGFAYVNNGTWSAINTIPNDRLDSMMMVAGEDVSLLNNDANYIDLTDLSSGATGLTYTNTTGVFSLTTGYAIPLASSMSNWDTVYGWGNHAAQNYFDKDIDVLAVTMGGTGLSTYGTANQIMGMDAVGNALEYKTVSGTTNQITITHAANSLTLALPQDIAAASTPTFGGLTLNGSQTLSGTLGIKETGDTPTYFTTFQGGDQGANITYTLPVTSTDGVMKNTAGVLTWDSTIYLTENQSITLSGDVTGTGTTAITTAVVNDSHDHSSTTLPTTISYLGTQIDMASEISGVTPIANGGTGTAVAFTPGSIVFAGTNGVYTEDNVGLFWDDATDRLGVGDNTPDHTLDIAGNLGLNASAYINFGDTDGSNGYGFRDNNGAMEFKNSTGDWTALGAGGAATFLELPDTPSTYTAGSILFTSGSAVIQDNSNLFWDDTYNRLGLGTTTPAYELDINGATGVTDLFRISYNGTSVMTVTEAQTSFYNPVTFAAAGDVSIAYDLLMENATAGNIKFYGPGNILTESAWQNLNLTLSAANTGMVVVDDTLHVTQKLGVGVSSPTALVNIAAGTATAGTAPLKFTSGTVLTTTEAGAIEYNGTHLYFTATNGGARYQLDQQGNMTNPMTTLGDMIYGGASGVTTRLAGAAGFLTSTGAAAPTWTPVTTDYFTQYARVAGRSGGQTIIGGTVANNTLILRGNSVTTGNTLTNIGMQFKVGDSGATDAITILNNGNVGIGNIAPTAYLNIKAGTANAGTAPIKLTSGVNLTTTEAGAIEFDGTHLYFTATNGGTRHQLDQQPGEMANPMTTLGDVIYGGDAGAPTRLAAASGFLTSDGASAPAWTAFATDSFTQYALLAGRSGGQSLIGGTLADNTLVLQGNSATTGNTLTNIGMQFKVGDSGATNAITVLNNGNVGFGVASPTALVNLAAGTATAGTAPLKFTSGTNLTTTEAGAMEFDGTHLYFTATNGGTRYQLDQQGDMTNPMTTLGDIMYGGAAGAPTRLAAASGFLTSDGASAPAWTAFATDSFTQYALLAGRSGGQSLIGGTLADNTLVLQGNSATTGNTLTNIGMQFKVGDSGATNAITVLNNGNVGFGVASPTALVNLAAGTATAGTAPLKFTSGTNLTTTEAGAMEFDGTHLYFTATNGGTRYQLDQQGDMTNPMTTLGDIMYGGAAGAPTRLAAASGFLTSDGASAPAWTAFATDSFTQYALLAGRSGGQSLIGGTLADNTLVLQGNSATTGNTLTNIGMQFKVGDSGATNAITVLNNGNVGIKAAAPSGALQIGGSPALSATSSLLGLGNSLSGATTGGTFIGVGAESTFGGHLLDFQINGTTIYMLNNGVAGSNGGVSSKYAIAQISPSVGGMQYGDVLNISNAPTTNANTAIGSLYFITDNTTLANTTYGIMADTSGGSNVAGTQYGVMGYGKTYGVFGRTNGIANGVTTPAAVYGHFTGTTSGNAFRGYSTSITSSSLLSLSQNSSTFTGNGLDMNFALTSGAFSGNFIDLKVNNVSQFKVDASGQVTAGGATLGLAGTSTGILRLEGSGSGYTQIQPASAAGSWTMTLPAAVGGAGEQLTDVAGNGVTTWTSAGSLRILKDIDNMVTDPNIALNQLLETNIYNFHYKEGMGTGDSDTQYVGVMADESPWAMHYDGRVINPVNTLGYMVLGVQALNNKIEVADTSFEEYISQTEQTITTLTLKTDSDATTLLQLQTSIDAQLAIAQESINNLVITNDDFETRMATLESASEGNGLLVAQLATQMEEIRAQVAEVDFVEMNDKLNSLLSFLDASDGVVKIDVLEATITETGALVIKNSDDEAPTIGTGKICGLIADTKDENGVYDNIDDCSGNEIPFDADGDGMNDWTENTEPMPKDEDHDWIDDDTKEGIVNNGKNIVIYTKAVNKNSKVFVTSTSSTVIQPLSVVEVQEGESFTVETDNGIKVDSSLEFNWWIVEEGEEK